MDSPNIYAEASCSSIHNQPSNLLSLLLLSWTPHFSRWLFSTCGSLLWTSAFTPSGFSDWWADQPQTPPRLRRVLTEVTFHCVSFNFHLEWQKNRAAWGAKLWLKALKVCVRSSFESPVLFEKSLWSQEIIRRNRVLYFGSSQAGLRLERAVVNGTLSCERKSHSTGESGWVWMEGWQWPLTHDITEQKVDL